MSTFCVVTNCGLVFFTGTFFEGYSWFARMAGFVLVEHILFIIKYAFSASVPDVPEEVELQLLRSEFINNKLIDNDPGEAKRWRDEGGWHVSAARASEPRHGPGARGMGTSVAPRARREDDPVLCPVPEGVGTASSPFTLTPRCCDLLMLCRCT